MTRGTTPTYRIKIAQEIDFSLVESFHMTLKQSSTNKVTTRIEAGSEAVDPVERAIDWTLTQDETLRFKDGIAELQVRGKFLDGSVFATKIYSIPVNKVLYDEVI